jgi:hypothetical protein
VFPRVREKVEPMTRRPRFVVLLTVALFAAACDGGEPSDPIGVDVSYSAAMASSWHWVGDPQRVEIGILGDGGEGVQIVTGGSINLSFDYLGSDGSGDPVAGPTATADFLSVPGSGPAGDAPTLSTGNGVYEANGVVFDQAGLWRVTATADIDGIGRRLDTTFPVAEESAIPAPGDPAPRTENLTIDSNVRKGAIDSRADGGGGIPDPELHRWTVADAIDQGRPALVLIGTPAYCTSRFCGPEVDELARMSEVYPDRAVYIHIEVWKDYNAQPQVMNEGAADWLLRTMPDGSQNMTEPWLYLIGADGVIVDRWGSLFDPADVEAALEALPAMES